MLYFSLEVSGNKRNLFFQPDLQNCDSTDFIHGPLGDCGPQLQVLFVVYSARRETERIEDSGKHVC